jgi:DNA end-binding protein Ku
MKIPKAKVTAKELDMALRLVEDMADEWKPAKYRDTYREDLLKRIKEKVKAGQTEELTEPEKGAQKPAKSAEVIDLMTLLKKSVEKKPKPAKRARRAGARRRAA